MSSRKSLWKDRLDKCIYSWPDSMARDLRRYLRDLRRRVFARKRTATSEARSPYWIPLPQWLARKYRRDAGSRNITQRFISDVMWGQYCLFLFLRIQDDVFDGQADFPSLIYASDQFLFEAESLFLKYFSGTSPFWDIYHDCLRRSTRGIIQADRLQRTVHTKCENLLGKYAEVSSIFKVGSAAVCVRADRMKDFVHITRFADELAKAGQILDDFEDVVEDLERKRFNYAAIVLLHGAAKN